MKSAAALLAGWSRFDHERPLPQVKSGISALERRLRDVLHFDDGNLRSTLDPDTPQDVLTAIGSMAEADVEVFLVFLSSHGLSDDHEYFLATGESQGLRREWLNTSLRHVVGEVSQAKAPIKVVIVDACLSGQVARQLPPGVDRAARETGTILIASSGPYEAAIAQEGADLSVFMDAFLRALEGDPDWPAMFSVIQLLERTQSLIVDLDVELPLPNKYSAGLVDTYPIFTNAQFDPTVSPGSPYPVDYELIARVLVVASDPDLARDTAQEMCALQDEELAGRVEWGIACSRPEALASAEEHHDVIVVGTEFCGRDDDSLLDTLRRLNPSACIVLLASGGRASRVGGCQALDCFALHLRPEDVTYPLDAQYVLTNGSHLEHLRALVRSLVMQRRTVLSRIRGTGVAVISMIERLERRDRLGQTSKQSIAVEMNRCLYELLGSWLQNGAQRDDAARLVGGFRLEVVDEGVSSCLVLRVDPQSRHFGGTAQGSMLLKVGPRIEIEDEIDRYRRYVQVGPEIKHRTDVVSVWLGSNIAGALYGGCGISVASRARLGLRSDVAPEKVVRSLLSPNSIAWYKVNGLPKTQLLAYFNQFGFNEDSAIDALLRQADVATEIFGERAEVAATSLRLVWPNTLWLDHDAVTKSHEAVIVHGELHFGSIVVRDDGSFGLVDYRNLGPGPRCIDFATADLNSLLDIRIPDGVSNHDAFRALTDLLEVALWPTHDATDVDAPDWLADYATFNAFLKHALFEFNEVRISEYLGCLFMVALRRSSFVGLAPDAERQRRDRLVVLAVLSTIAQILRFEPEPLA